jgi:hypothetical protein
MAHRYLVRTLTALAAAFTLAAALALAAVPAAAAPAGSGIPPNCWIDAGMYQQGDYAFAYAYKDCTNLEVPQPLSVSIQVLICDPGHCFWPSLAVGSGTVHGHCSPGPMRNSRLPGEYFHCV